MMRDTLLLIGLHNRLLWKSVKTLKWTVKLLSVFMVFFVIMLGGVSALVGEAAAELIRRSDARFEALGPGLLLTGALAVLTISSFGIALGALFLSGDLERLMVAPVKRRAVFIAKLLDGLWFYYGLLLTLAAPALAAYGLRLSYQPLYYVMCALTLITAPLLGTGVGALATMLIARFAPARRIREVLTAVAGVLGLALSLLSQLPRLWLGGALQNVGAGTEQLTRTLEQWNKVPLPTLWAGRGLVAAGQGKFGEALVQLAVYLAITLGFFALCVILAEALYASGWTRMQGAGVARRKPRRVYRGSAPRLPMELELAVKDWRFIVRDLRMLPRLLSPLVALPILYLSFVNPLGGRANAATSEYLDRLKVGGGLGGAALAVGVLTIAAMLCSQISMVGLSMEGRSFWVLKVAPISAWQILRGKLLAALLPFIAISSVLFGFAAASQHRGLGWSLYAWAGIELLGGGALAFSAGLSVPWARFDWEDPRKMTPGIGGLIAFLGYILYGIPAGLALSLPLIIERAAPAYLPLALALCFSIALLWTVLFAGGSLLLAANALRRVGES